MKSYVIPGIVVISRQEKGPDGFCFTVGTLTIAVVLNCSGRDAVFIDPGKLPAGIS